MKPERTYDDAEIASKLATLPHWAHVDGALTRTYTTANFKATMMVVVAVGHLCEAAWHHPEMLIGYNKVTVRLSTHSAQGITDKDFALARKIEDVVGWRPGAEAGPFDGTPDDPRHAYLKHD